MKQLPGRSCPMSYRYEPEAIATSPEQSAEILYVIGGLYGNLPALETIEALAGCERSPVTLCFNGDFNWFNVDDDSFMAVNNAVLAHHAMLGNVEAELMAADDDAGCGCAYPDDVDADIAERSNRIHARLKVTALKHPKIINALRRLPMLRRYRVGNSTIGVVHGDAHSLSGWDFDVTALDDGKNRDRIVDSFRQAAVDIFASTHTCLPALRSYMVDGTSRVVINNGAAGMPNFSGDQRGLITRISLKAAVCEPIYSQRVGNTHVDAIAIDYDHARWQSQFQRNWPAGSPAWISYIERIEGGPEFSIEKACLAIN